MKKIMWVKLYSSILEKDSFDLAVETEGRTHVGALLFEMDFDTNISEVIEEVVLDDHISNEEFLNAIVTFYSKHSTTMSPSTESTMRHWFSMNGVAEKAIENTPENYGEIVKVGGRSFRYNKVKCVIEYIMPDRNNRVISSIGLSTESFNQDFKYWAEVYNSELEEDFTRSLAEFKTTDITGA